MLVVSFLYINVCLGYFTDVVTIIEVTILLSQEVIETRPTAVKNAGAIGQRLSNNYGNYLSLVKSYLHLCLTLHLIP